jgi:hypothetical protein
MMLGLVWLGNETDYDGYMDALRWYVTPVSWSCRWTRR